MAPIIALMRNGTDYCRLLNKSLPNFPPPVAFMAFLTRIAECPAIVDFGSIYNISPSFHEFSAPFAQAVLK